MAGPTLSPEQIAQLQKELAQQTNVRDAMLALVPAKEARVAELAVVDSSYKSFFDYYNNDIIAHYDAERKALNGEYLAAPIVEDDVLKPANLEGHRTTPTLPATDLIRVPEFDGGPLIIEPNNESQNITNQAAIETSLVSGFSGSAPTITGTSLTKTVLTGSSTTLDVEDVTGPMSFSIGNVFMVQDGGSNAAMVEVTGVTDNAGGDPPYDITLDIKVLVAPASSLAIGSDLDISFSGFNDSERDTKTASNSNHQPVMDALISTLQTAITNRISNLATQTVSLNSNQDPDATSQIASVLLLVAASDSFLSNYLLTTDVSDIGLGTLSTERGVRSPEITTRLGQIVANFTGQTDNYFDNRYAAANDRGSTSRGSLRLQKNAEQGIGTAQGMADSAQDSIDSINSLLP